MFSDYLKTTAANHKTDEGMCRCTEFQFGQAGFGIDLPMMREAGVIRLQAAFALR